MRKKGIPEVLVRSVMCLYEGAKTRVRVDSELLEELEVIVGMLQGSVLSPFLFAVVVDVVTEFAREGALRELLHADYLVLMSETIAVLRNTLLKWKETFESKGLNVNIGKTELMVCEIITMDDMSKSQVDSCGVCSMKVKAFSVLCLHYGKWIDCRCNQKGDFFRKFYMQKMWCKYCRQWSRKKRYVIKSKLKRNSHILLTGWVQVEDERLL